MLPSTMPAVGWTAACWLTRDPQPPVRTQVVAALRPGTVGKIVGLLGTNLTSKIVKGLGARAGLGSLGDSQLLAVTPVAALRMSGAYGGQHGAPALAALHCGIKGTGTSTHHSCCHSCMLAPHLAPHLAAGMPTTADTAAELGPSKTRPLVEVCFPCVVCCWGVTPGGKTAKEGHGCFYVRARLRTSGGMGVAPGGTNVWDPTPRRACRPRRRRRSRRSWAARALRTWWAGVCGGRLSLVWVCRFPDALVH